MTETQTFSTNRIAKYFENSSVSSSENLSNSIEKNFYNETPTDFNNALYISVLIVSKTAKGITYNKYAFCNNNPWRYTDPTGEMSQENHEKLQKLIDKLTPLVTEKNIISKAAAFCYIMGKIYDYNLSEQSTIVKLLLSKEEKAGQQTIIDGIYYASQDLSLRSSIRGSINACNFGGVFNNLLKKIPQNNFVWTNGWTNAINTKFIKQSFLKFYERKILENVCRF